MCVFVVSEEVQTNQEKALECTIPGWWTRSICGKQHNSYSFSESLRHARHCSKNFMCMITLILHSNLKGWKMLLL